MEGDIQIVSFVDGCDDYGSNRDKQVESGHNDRDFMWEDMLNYRVQGDFSLVDLGLESAA